MGKEKKHKRDREVSSRRRSRSRSRSRSEEYREKKRGRKTREKEKERDRKHREKSYHSDSKYSLSIQRQSCTISSPLAGSDVVEVPVAPEPPSISKNDSAKSSRQRKSRSHSPIPADGAGDVLSIAETNKLRAKLGLKPLEVGPSEVVQSSSSKKDDERDENAGDLKKIKDDWGEFYHKPAGQFNEKTEVELLREKIQAKRDKRKIEDKLARIKTLGEADSGDDATAWVDKSRKIDDEKKKAKMRTQMFEEMDEDFDKVTTTQARRPSARPKKASSSKSQNYGSKDLKGLKVAHDIDAFKEDRQVILTLEDKGVLDEDGDTLMNVNMKDNERYKKNTEVKKQNPQHYGYDVYEDQYDQFGMFIGRGVLAKYDDEIEGTQKTSFTIGESKELIQQQQRKALEVKAKLEGKRLESLNEETLKLATDCYTEEELTKFKKPKRKVKKIRQKLKADELLDIAGDSTTSKDLGSRKRKGEEKPKTVVLNADAIQPLPEEDTSNFKVEQEDDDLEHMLSKARRLKQKEIIKKDVSAEGIKTEVKMETEESDEEGAVNPANNFIMLNQTAEFCRTLGDIPTYGMAGNRDEATDMMDLEDEVEEEVQPIDKRGKWNQVDPNEEPKLIEGIPLAEQEDVAILDEEPDIASGVANALKLAMSKGYLEKEESNRPSNTRFAHLQAQHYSIDDKAHGEDDKYHRRGGGGGGGGYGGPLSEFREKPGYRPNVKLEYIDDNNQKLTPKEAFRYLSHKFHGKGPGKNKIEKRLKKMEQEGVSFEMISSLLIF
jgi:U4/U6.U5 tri-snRNP-associated protein 1